MSKVLVVAVHPDDESLGCGGTLLNHKKRNEETHWLIVTTPEGNPNYSTEFLEKRKKEITYIENFYGFKKTHCAGFMAGAVEQVKLGNRIDILSKIISEVKPDIIYLPFLYDVHSDHRATFEALMACTKKFRYPFIKKLLMMEVISETEFSPSLSSMAFIPNVFSDITETLDGKLEALSVFESEMSEHPFPRSFENVKALATYRGAMSGCQYAESFMLLKEYI